MLYPEYEIKHFNYIKGGVLLQENNQQCCGIISFFIFLVYKRGYHLNYSSYKQPFALPDGSLLRLSVLYFVSFRKLLNIYEYNIRIPRKCYLQSKEPLTTQRTF